MRAVKKLALSEFSEYCDIIKTPANAKKNSLDQSSDMIVLNHVISYSEINFPASNYQEFGVHLASLINPRPIVSIAESPDITQYRALSEQVYLCLYRFNKTRLEVLLQNQIFSYIIRHYIERPEFLSDSGIITKTPNTKGKHQVKSSVYIT